MLTCFKLKKKIFKSTGSEYKFVKSSDKNLSDMRCLECVGGEGESSQAGSVSGIS